MKYLKISNKGEIDIKALKLMGASSKRDNESMIGYFGSGIKYAIAFLTRENYEFKIYSGLKEINFTSKSEFFRNINFDVIYINGFETSFTTEMGPDWQLWYAIREIYCNALDEDEGDIEEVDEMIRKEGYTYFYIKTTPEIKEFLSHFSEYFSIKRTDFVYEHILNEGNYNFQLRGDCNIKLFRSLNENTIIYRKGIQCKSSNLKSIYNYDLEKVEINESRIAKYEWEIKEKIESMYGYCNNINVLRKLFNYINDSEYYEKYLDWNYANIFSETWIDAINGRILVPYLLARWFAEVKNQLVLPDSLIKNLVKYFGDRVEVPPGYMGNKPVFKIKKLEPLQSHIYKLVCDFMDECKIKIKYPIKFAEFKDTPILGLALMDLKEIIINIRCFDKGKHTVLMAILEEQIHIDSGEDDCTRGFQYAMLEFIVKYIQEINTIAL